MRHNSLIRFLIILFVATLIACVWGSKAFPASIPKILFEVLGILFPLSLAVLSSIDFLRVKNKSFRREFRSNLREVRNTLIVQFTLALLAICFVLLEVFITLEITDKLILNTHIIATGVILYAVMHAIYSFISIQKFKDALDERLQDEGV